MEPEVTTVEKGSTRELWTEEAVDQLIEAAGLTGRLTYQVARDEWDLSDPARKVRTVVELAAVRITE
jgi:hypothetical protein